MSMQENHDPQLCTHMSLQVWMASILIKYYGAGSVVWLSQHWQGVQSLLWFACLLIIVGLSDSKHNWKGKCTLRLQEMEVPREIFSKKMFTNCKLLIKSNWFLKLESQSSVMYFVLFILVFIVDYLMYVINEWLKWELYPWSKQCTRLKILHYKSDSASFQVWNFQDLFVCFCRLVEMLLALIAHLCMCFRGNFIELTKKAQPTISYLKSKKPSIKTHLGKKPLKSSICTQSFIVA